MSHPLYRSLLVGLGLLVACAGPRPAPVTTTPSIAPATPPMAPSPGAATPTPLAGRSADTTLVLNAVQTVLDYYGAIRAGRYRDAYALWADAGAASGQSFEQFRQGYVATAELRVLISDTPQATAAGVRVPVALVAIDNGATANASQITQNYAGEWLVAGDASGALRLREARITPVALSVVPPELQQPAAVMPAYNTLLGQRRYAQAYTFWADLGHATGQEFADFVAEQAEIDTVTPVFGQVRLEGAAGSLYAGVPAAVLITRTDGMQQVLCGVYTLRRSNLPPFDQLGWRIEQAQLQPLADGARSIEQLRQLLGNGCQP
ncbi:hypothetical protein [Kallotenue papyrolyticum]|uniref:hypothetical protein n=1 Tax=Kallotenue papyrolyticum TaxID=1325125 RepID=UPI0004785E86|nr:hypothetical protein [Kallotenue papyrolyticum]